MRATDSAFDITWVDFGREPQCEPDPAFPEGVDVVVSSKAANHCKSDLPYPAARCGAYSVVCEVCGFSAVITTAGRADDPRSIALPCRLAGGKQ